MSEPPRRSPFDEFPDSPSETTIPASGEPRLWPARILGDRYRIDGLLGRGGMGEVWRAYDLKLCVEVALKAIHPGRVDDQLRELLRREVRAAREVVSANVCRIFDLVEIDGHELVSMELVDGETLGKILQEQGAPKVSRAQEMASQLLAGLQAIHEAGFVHRDLKPDNVMVTRSGRVLLMDFGIAKAMSEGTGGTIAGTPAYMAPEQARGEGVDARTDVYAAGIVLAELVYGSGNRQGLLEGIRKDPPRLPEGPWRDVLLRAVAFAPRDRFPSARALAKALEEMTLRVEGRDDRRPYPGLSFFTEANAEFFFGRETDIEALGKKLQRLHLLAVVGPSGVGKSSFLRAGLLPSLPRDWVYVVCTPGPSPFMALGRALAPQLAGDTEALGDLVGFSEAATALSILARWRRRHAGALVIVDQFEELFTQNPQPVQAQFADLLGRLSLEADVRVLLSMRDDFLFHCHAHPGLRPILTELTLLAPLQGSDLRRALVQPALSCGFRFESESLIERMAAEVENERGALPLLAFTAAQLWEARDRERGLLTSEAYEKIGGVGGSLAQHAEATLGRIGSDQQDVVREIFRQLVTGQGTRISREREELLSVFENAQEAGRTLGQLIDARLLTSYEVGDDREPGGRRQRVEIVHESLLTHWPRLVRWQTQDADGAQLHDQLRQAARLWEERGRPEDMLWTGTVYQEFRLWKERAQAGLTAGERDYAEAMTRKAERLRRRRRRILTATVASLAAVSLAITGLWVSARISERHAEANALQTMARGMIDRNATSALAYATAALDRHDTPEGRRLAMEALLAGPPALALAPVINPVPGDSLDCSCYNSYFAWSPDGQWLAEACSQETIRLWSRDGSPPKILRPPQPVDKSWMVIRLIGFSPASDVLVYWSIGSGNLYFWSIPEGHLLRSVFLSAEVRPVFGKDSILLVPRLNEDPGRRRRELFSCSYETGDITSLGEREFQAGGSWKVSDGSFENFLFNAEDGIYLVKTDSIGLARPRLVARHRGGGVNSFNPVRGLVATADDSSCRIWSLAHGNGEPLWTLPRRNDADGLRFTHDGRRITGPCDADLGLLDLTAGPGALFTYVPLRPATGYSRIWASAFHPADSWLSASFYGTNSIIPLDHPYPRKLWVHRNAVYRAYFTPDGKELVWAGSEGTIRAWSLERGPEEGSRLVLDAGGLLAEYDGFTVSPSGNLLAASLVADILVVPRVGGEPRLLSGFSGAAVMLAIDATDRWVAAAGGNWGLEEALIRVWDLETDDVRVLDSGERKYISGIRFLPDGRLVSVGDGGVRLWNVKDGTSRLLHEEPIWWDPSGVSYDPGRVALTPDGRGVRIAFPRSGQPGGVEHMIWDIETDRWRHAAYGEVHFNVRGDLYLRTEDENRILACGRVTPGASGEEEPVLEDPHLVYRGPAIESCTLSPDGTQAAVSTSDGSVYLVPIPAGRPLQTLPRREFLARLRAMTNVRAVPDAAAQGGYRLEDGPFPGWKTPPEW